MTAQRHSWGDPVRFERKTERECAHCGLVKVTRHEQEIWTEFWRDGVQLRQFGERTPPCMPPAASSDPTPVEPYAHGKTASQQGGSSA